MITWTLRLFGKQDIIINSSRLFSAEKNGQVHQMLKSNNKTAIIELKQTPQSQHVRASWLPGRFGPPAPHPAARLTLPSCSLRVCPRSTSSHVTAAPVSKVWPLALWQLGSSCGGRCRCDTCLGLGSRTVIEVDDEVDFPLWPKEGRVAGVDKERGVQQVQVFRKLCQLVWEGVQHCV